MFDFLLSLLAVSETEFLQFQFGVFGCLPVLCLPVCIRMALSGP